MKLKWFENNKAMAITNEEFKVHADHFRSSVEKEELPIREVAKHLNLAPYYVSMALNPKSWDSMSRAAKERIIEFSMSRGKIQDFVIPEGKPIWIPEGKPKSSEQKAQGEDPGAQSKEEKPKPEPERKWRKVEKPAETKAGLSKPAVDKAIKVLKEKLSGDDLAEKIVEKYSPVPKYEEKSPAGGNEVFWNSRKIKLSIDIEINLIINGHKIQLA